MIGVFRTVLIMSISGSIIAILLFALKPLVRNFLPKFVQYYLWLVVIAAFLLPLSGIIKLPTANDNSPIAAMPSNIVHKFVITVEEELDRIAVIGTQTNNESMRNSIEASGQQSSISAFTTVLMIISPFGTLAVFLYCFISYAAFKKKYDRLNIAAKEHEISALSDINRDYAVPKLFRNPIAQTPMLIGLLSPAIILPAEQDFTDTQLYVVLQHELIHLHRKDVLMKWLSVFACAVHWFNPIVWLVRREIDRACELSCDEAVIRDLDNNGKQNYGDTLISVAAYAKTPLTVLSTTMCEEKKTLKERLGAIMKSRKYNRIAVVLSTVLIIAVVGMTVILGAGRADIRGIRIKGFDPGVFDPKSTDSQTTGFQNYGSQTVTSTISNPDFFEYAVYENGQTYSSNIVDDRNATTDANIIVYVDANLTLDEARALGRQIRAVENVRAADFITSEEAYEAFMLHILQSDDSSRYESIAEGIDVSMFNHRFKIRVDDISLVYQTQHALASIDGITHANA